MLESTVDVQCARLSLRYVRINLRCVRIDLRCVNDMFYGLLYHCDYSHIKCFAVMYSTQGQLSIILRIGYENNYDWKTCYFTQNHSSNAQVQIPHQVPISLLTPETYEREIHIPQHLPPKPRISRSPLRKPTIHPRGTPSEIIWPRIHHPHPLLPRAIVGIPRPARLKPTLCPRSSTPVPRCPLPWSVYAKGSRPNVGRCPPGCARSEPASNWAGAGKGAPGIGVLVEGAPGDVVCSVCHDMSWK